MHGHVIVNFCLPSVMQSLLFSNRDGILPLYIVTSTEQSSFYIKCYKTRTNYAYSSIWLPSNRLTRFL